MANPPTLPAWPEYVESPALVSVSGRHLSADSAVLAKTFAWCAGTKIANWLLKDPDFWAAFIECGRSVCKSLHTLLPSVDQRLIAVLMVFLLFGLMYRVAYAVMKGPADWAFQLQTRILFYADHVDVKRWGRRTKTLERPEGAAIKFVVVKGSGLPETLGRKRILFRSEIAAAYTLLMIYGYNRIEVATFISRRQAIDFKHACMTALGASLAKPVQAFPVLPLEQPCETDNPLKAAG